MKFLTRYCSLLLSVAILSVAFSVNVSAVDETYFNNLEVEQQIFVYKVNMENGNETTIQDRTYTFFPSNSNIETQSHSALFLTFSENDETFYFFYRWFFRDQNNARLFKGGQEVTVKFENGYYNVGLTKTSTSTYFSPNNYWIIVYYTDGTEEYINIPSTNVVIGRPTSFQFTFTPQKDVNQIEFATTSDYFTANTYDGMWVHMGEMNGDNTYQMYFEVQSEEAGLLTSIVQWIKRIVDGITSLPQKIWDLISSGLQSLFVPSEDSLMQFKDNMNSLLENKLGAIYQVVNVMVEGWDNIQANDVSNTIDFPEVTIPLPDGNSFTFGGYQVLIVPEGFDVLVNAIKLITGICCTILFINGLKKRYDEIMGGN